MDDLTEALVATGATAGLDANRRWRLAGQNTHRHGDCSEQDGEEYSRYGSHTQGRYTSTADWTAADRVQPHFGMAWGIGGWLLTAFLQKNGFEARRSCDGGSRPRSRPRSRAPTRRKSLSPSAADRGDRRLWQTTTGGKYLITRTKDSLNQRCHAAQFAFISPTRLWPGYWASCHPRRSWRGRGYHAHLRIVTIGTLNCPFRQSSNSPDAHAAPVAGDPGRRMWKPPTHVSSLCESRPSNKTRGH